MKRPVLTLCLAVFATLAAPAAAQDAGSRVQKAIIAQLTSQGFTHVRISNTILGRVRIFASSPDATREIIFNPRTGEILRDYWDDTDDIASGPVSPSGSGSRGGGLTGSDEADRDEDQDADTGGGDEDDTDDDRDEKEDDDDEEDDEDEDDDEEEDDEDDDDDERDDD